MSKIVERDGFLFVQDEWEPYYSIPVQDRVYWPTGVRSSAYPELVGQDVTYTENGVYRTKDGLAIRLEYGGKTKAAWRDTRPISMPREKGSYRWARGHWERIG